MSDDERASSDDDGADLFESEPEDHGSEVEQSLDLPPLSLDLYVRAPQQTEEDGRGEGENPGYETDQSGVDGFDIGDGASRPPVGETEDEELPGCDDSPEDDGDDHGQAEQEINPSSRSGDEAESEKDPGDEEGVAIDQPSTTITQCESPILPEPADRQQHDADEKLIENHDKPSDEFNIARETHLDGDCTRKNDVQRDELTRLPSSGNEMANPSFVPASAIPDKTIKDDELVSLPAESEALIAELNQAAPTQMESGNERNATDEISARENTEQQATDSVKTSLTDSIKNSANHPVYTVESLFPVLYEKSIPPAAAPNEIAKVVPITSTSSNTQSPGRRRRTHTGDNKPHKGIASRLAALQAQLHVAHSELANATRTFKLQLSMVETDKKKFSQRNARLKSQLSVATADLQRSNSETAKLKTENELYAAKLPRLQAELLEETSQADETQAQSVQTQLLLTQLKARSHVLQTRNLSLEAQNNKLTQQLRECQQQLMRKTAALQQQAEKSSKMEADLNGLKTIHTQEKMDWKNRLATAVQRYEHEKIKLETQSKISARKELSEAKDRAEKAVKKRRTVEATAAKLEEQLKHCKHEVSSANGTVQRNIHEVRTLESLLRKTHRTEATLRNDLAACKAKLRTLQDEKKRRMARPASFQTRRQRLQQQIPVELLLPLTDSSDDEEGDNQETQCCSNCLASVKAFEPQPPPPSVCSQCPQLQDQLHRLQQELRRVRALHTAELHAQASILDALLQHTKGNLQ